MRLCVLDTVFLELTVRWRCCQDTVIGIMALSRFATVFSATDSLSLDINIRARKNGVDVTTHDFTSITEENAFIYQTREINTVGDVVVVVIWHVIGMWRVRLPRRLLTGVSHCFRLTSTRW